MEVEGTCSLGVPSRSTGMVAAGTFFIFVRRGPAGAGALLAAQTSRRVVSPPLMCVGSASASAGRAMQMQCCSFVRQHAGKGV